MEGTDLAADMESGVLFSEKQLQTFWAVAESGSFLGASKALYVSQPALTKQINHLEERLGFRLFKRSNKGVELTEAGKKYFHETRRLSREYAAILHSCRSLADRASDSLRVGYMSNMQRVYSLMVVEVYRKRFPKVDVQLVETTTESCVRDLLSGRIEVFTCFDSRRFDQADIVFTKLGEYGYFCVLSPEDPLAGKKTLQGEELVGRAVTLPAYGLFRGTDALRDMLLSRDAAANISEEIYSNSTAPKSIIQGRIFVSFGIMQQHGSNISIPLAWDPPAAHGVVHLRSTRKTVESFVSLSIELRRKT